MLQNPPTLYSAGNVVLDSSPYMRIVSQQKAKQQAIDEAAYRHYSELPDKLNSAGVRSQDWEDPNGNGGIGQDIENTKRFFIENSKDILKGGSAASAYSKMMQDNLRKIAASKAEGKFQLETGKAFFDGKHRYRENDLKVKDAVDKSIYDPTHYKDPELKMPYSFSDYSVAAAPYTPQIEMAHNRNITNGIVPDRDTKDKGVLDEVAKKVTYTYGYSPEKLKQIGINASVDAANSTTLGNKYEDMLSNPADIQRATAALQSVYGKTDPQTGEELVADTKEKMAAGVKIAEYSQMKIPKTFTDIKSLEEYRTKERLARQAFTRAENQKREKGKDKRLALMQQYNIPDLYNDALERPTVKFKDPSTGIEIDLVEVTDMTSQQEEDLYGKKDTRTMSRDYQPIEIGNKKYLKKIDGKLVDSENKPLDPDAVFAKTFGRLKASKEAVAKQKVAKGGSTQKQPSETKSLAERMKEAKQKK